MNAASSRPESPFPWPAEIELLLACARAEMADADIVRASDAISRGVDWSRVLVLAREHCVIPLLHRQVKRGHAAAPSQIVVRLDAAQERIARRNLRLSQALLEIVGVLASAGIRALPFKGPVLAQHLYGSVALRQFGDLDVLVSAAQMDDALRVLREAGYTRRLSGESLQENERRHSHHVSLVGPRRDVPLELHRSLISNNYGFSVGLDEIDQDITSTAFMGRTMPALTPEALVAYLCQHGAGHEWSRIEWMATARESVRRARVDELWRVAERFGADGHVRAGLELFDALFVSPTRLAHLSDANALVCARLSGAAPPALLGYAFKTSGSWRVRARRLRGLLLTPHEADARAVPMPSGWSAMHYVVRPLRLIARACTRGWRRRGAMHAP